MDSTGSKLTQTFRKKIAPPQEFHKVSFEQDYRPRYWSHIIASEPMRKVVLKFAILKIKKLKHREFR